MICKVLILGFGYTASYLKPFIEGISPGTDVFTTSRKGSPHVRFDLEDETSWSNLPDVDVTFWTFPAKPPSQVQALLTNKQKTLGKIVAIGSTGSFIIKKEHETVDESSPLDLKKERVQGENDIRQAGGCVVESAGIYGPQRSPVDWVQRGLVGSSDKYLNVIHVVDLAQVLWKAALKGRPGRVYVAADGHPYTWDELIQVWEQEFGVSPSSNAKPSSRPSKRLNPRRSLQELEVDLAYPDVITGVRQDNQ